MDKDIFWKGSDAVDSARTWITVLSAIALVIGLICLFMSFGETAPLFTGIALIGSAISGFILRAILRGFYGIVRASEAFLEDRYKMKEAAKAETEEK